jgi:hypothetical protein
MNNFQITNFCINIDERRISQEVQEIDVALADQSDRYIYLINLSM